MIFNQKMLILVCLAVLLQPISWADQHSFHIPNHPMEQERAEASAPMQSTNHQTETSNQSGAQISSLAKLSSQMIIRRNNSVQFRLLGVLTREMSAYGFRIHPISGKRKLHTGIDFAAPRGTKIFAAAHGTIKEKKRHRDYGNMIVISHQNGLETLYAHMDRFAANVSVNQAIKAGELIGYVGSTGRSTGPHLHYEIRRGGKPVNPKKNAHLLL